MNEWTNDVSDRVNAVFRSRRRRAAQIGMKAIELIFTDDSQWSQLGLYMLCATRYAHATHTNWFVPFSSFVAFKKNQFVMTTAKIHLKSHIEK